MGENRIGDIKEYHKYMIIGDLGFQEVNMKID
jgi:hypothetical protein